MVLSPGRLATVLLVLAIPASAGCSRGSGSSRGSPSATPAGPPVVVPRPASAEAYQPPANGHLARAQVEAYLSLHERLRREPARASPGPSDLVDDLGPEIAAAGELGLSPEEYLWVKESVLEAEAAVEAARLNASAIALLEKTVSDLKARAAEARDDETRALLADQISGFEGELQRVRREAAEREPDWIVANVKLLEPYQERLRPLDKELAKARIAAVGLAGRESAPTTTPPHPPQGTPGPGGGSR